MRFRITAQKALAAGMAVLLLVCGAVWFFLPRDKSGLYAEVTIQGEKVMEIPLDQKGESKIWDLQEEYGVPVHLETGNGRIRFTDVDCPDHICENTGWLTMAYQSAVCMPNRTVVTVYQRLVL